MELLLVVMAGVSFVGSALLTGAVSRRLHRGRIDVPNERSLHVVPTPRGGGLGIVVMVLGASCLAVGTGWLSVRIGTALIGGGLLVAGLGWMDDRRSLANAPRMAVWVLAAAWGVVWIGGLPSLNLGLGHIELGPVGAIVALVATIWMVNLYNFMDGSDGLAGTEGLFAAGAAAAMLAWSGAWGLAVVAGVMASACAGFLVWNWPPARVFMGDVGSTFLGYTFAMLALSSESTGALPILVWGLLLGVFIIDATLTVGRRIVRREPFYTAHCSHAYQQVILRGRSHREVAIGVGVVNAILVIGAWLAWQNPAAMLFIVASVVLSLAAVWWVLVQPGSTSTRKVASTE